MRRFCRHCGVLIEVVETDWAGAIWMHRNDAALCPHYLVCRLPQKVAAPPEDVGIADEHRRPSNLDGYTACEGANE